ncbi:neutral zinc metallopeptidase [Amycolatopsis solani]|uniref:neutral zinc metallopeptidase n=1 Tax=Amycolatopsis solani TaxID=3028615 RepID=UPI0025B160F9|nr:neutral zinc metallopeptidase [Amycolatopsis sp. MEP2-6]
MNDDGEPGPPGPAWAPEPNPWAPNWAAAPPVPIAPPHHRLWGAVGGVLIVVLTISLIAATIPRRVDGRAFAAQGADTGRAYSGGTEVKPVPELARNPLLSDGITPGPATCALPDLGRSADQLEAYYGRLADCLAESWRPALEKANEPRLIVTVSVKLPEHSACGAAPTENEAVAYYCGGDTTIYAPTDWMLADAGLNKARHIATIAHEYGHHVQRESGILSAAADKMTSPDEDSAADKEVVRRIELQANCFGALFLAAVAGTGSISRSLANAAVADYGRANDSDTHGSRKHQLSWAKAGYDGKTTKACDTWSAPVAEVS